MLKEQPQIKVIRKVNNLLRKENPLSLGERQNWSSHAQRPTKNHWETLRVNNKKHTIVTRSESQASKDIREKQILKQKQVPQHGSNNPFTEWDAKALKSKIQLWKKRKRNILRKCAELFTFM